MEDQKALNLIETIEQLHPEIQIGRSQDHFFEGLHHFSITQGEGRLHRGFGSDLDPNTALIKAYSEFIERSAFAEYIKTHPEVNSTNGFASHLSIDLAKMSAQCEVLERDAVLTCWNAYKSPMWLQSEELIQLGSTRLDRINSNLDAANMSIKIGIVAKTGSFLTFIAALTGDFEGKPYFAIDAATSTSSADSINKVIRGASYFASVVYERAQSDLPLFNNVDPDDIKSTSDHYEYYLDPENFPDFYFNRSDSIPELTYHGMKFERITPSFDIAIPLQVVYAYNSKYQDYYIGRKHKPNLDRIEEHFEIDEFNTLLHPLS